MPRKPNLVDRLGLDLTRQIKNPTWVGSAILDDVKRRNPIASRREFSLYSQDEYGKMLQDSIQTGTRKFHGDFYLEVTYMRDKFHSKVFKMVPSLRNSCPIPFYGKDMFKYNSKDGKMELYWAIPERDMCEHPELIPLETEELPKLLETIKNFNNGFYLEVYKKLIKEDEKI
jgi:hypothetical protein